MIFETYENLKFQSAHSFLVSDKILTVILIKAANEPLVVRGFSVVENIYTSNTFPIVAAASFWAAVVTWA